MGSRVLIEVAVSTVDDARVAHAEGADRLELSAALELGGLTPSVGLLDEVVGETPLPVIVMIRPRGGGFAYSDGEFGTMLRDVDAAFGHGAAGVAFGVLTAERGIDLDRTKALVERVAGRGEAVFHRAFDYVLDPLAAVDQLVGLGVTRVLTSGGRVDAPAGAGVIRRLVDWSAGRIEILPGGGVTAGNVAALVAETGARQVHGTFSEERWDPGGPACEGRYRVTWPVKLRETRAAVARL
jgi:copper homeostasis protein